MCLYLLAIQNVDQAVNVCLSSSYTERYLGWLCKCVYVAT